MDLRSEDRTSRPLLGAAHQSRRRFMAGSNAETGCAVCAADLHRHDQRAPDRARRRRRQRLRRLRESGTDRSRPGVANIDKIKYRGEYEETSPPAIVDDLVIVGSAIGDNGRVDEPSGVVRAFDARSGALRWSWDPIPQTPDDPAWKTWSHSGAPNSGAANTWAMISVDPRARSGLSAGSSASPDYYGGERPGDDVYSDSLVALHGATGKLAWYFQTTHHDLWDYDNPSHAAAMHDPAQWRRGFPRSCRAPSAAACSFLTA